MPGCSAARSATNATCAPHRGTPASPSASTPAQPGTQHEEVTMRRTLARPTDVPRASRLLRALGPPGVPGVPGRIGRTWSVLPTRYARSHQPSRPFWERSGVPAGTRRPGRPPVRAYQPRTGVLSRIGHTWSVLPTRYARSHQPSRPFWERTGVPAGTRRPERPPVRAYRPRTGVPGRIGRTWSVLPTRYARFHQPSRPFWEGTGVTAGTGRPARPPIRAYRPRTGVPGRIGRTWSVLLTRYARFHQPRRPFWERTDT